MASEYWNRFHQMRANRRRFLGTAGLAGAGAASFALVGCGDDDDDTGGTQAPSSGSPSTSGSATAAPAAKGNPGGTAKVALSGISSGNPPTIFPYENLTYLAQTPSAYHYSRLVRAVAKEGVAVEDKTVVEGDIASAWETPDANTYVFKLKANAKWHNKAPLNGKAVAAQDIVDTWTAFLATSQNKAKFGAVIDTVTAPDEKTVKMTLKAPFAPFLTSMAGSTEGLWLIPASTIDTGQAKQDPVGSGPFIFREWTPSVSIKWDKNPDYYDTGIPYYNKVEAGLSNDSQRLVAALKTGELDLSGLSGAIYKESRSQLDPKGKDVFTQGIAQGALYFNFDNKPFNDKRVRQAISMLLDRDGYLKVQDGTGKGNWFSHIPPGLAPYYLSPKDPAFGTNAKYYKQNVAEAKALLQAAGADKLDGIKLIGNVDRYGNEAKTAWELISADLKTGGFNHELVFQEYATYIQTVFLGKMEPNTFALGPLIGSPSDPDDIFVTNYWSKSARHNWGGTPIAEQPEIDAMIEKQRGILDVKERITFIQDMQKKMAESMLVVPYHSNAGYIYVQPWVENYFHKNGYAYAPESLAKSWFSKERAAKG